MQGVAELRSAFISTDKPYHRSGSSTTPNTFNLIRFIDQFFRIHEFSSAIGEVDDGKY